MKKFDKQFDRLVLYSEKVVRNGNYFSVYGYLLLAISVLVHFISNDRTAIGIGMMGVLFGYIGVAVSVLARDRGTRMEKVAMIVALPFLIALLVQVFRI